MMRGIQYFGIIFLILLSCQKKQEIAEQPQSQADSQNMHWIGGGNFTMGSSDPNSYQHELPAHPVSVKGFYLDETEVTNSDFKKFVDATGYKTIAEKAPDWEELKKQLPPGTPKPEQDLKAGSLVFVQPDHTIVSMDDYSQWWQWVDGANWQRPEGPESNIEQRWNHPVVHIAHEDAIAYCEWSGKRLPTEAEWEFASRGGQDDKMYAWGNEFAPNGKFMANTFQGAFPTNNTLDDGFFSTSPVKSFPPNGYGLYDMIGNVWEWTSDLYDYNYYGELAKRGNVANPVGSPVSFDPSEPFVKKYVTRGGSFLCSSNYCVNYRPSARQGTAFDSGSSNIGFRCAKDR